MPESELMVGEQREVIYRINLLDINMKKSTLLIVYILTSQLIFADAGTPLMWASLLQLICGNFLIGIIEGLFVKLIYKAKLLRSILIMILANYVSWIAGYFLINLYQNLFINTVFDIKFVFEAWITSLIILYLITVFLEAGFIYWIFKKNETFKKSIIISFIVNLVSYIGIIIIYLQCSSFTFFSRTHIDQTLLDNRKEKLIIYFIDNKGKNVNAYDFDSKVIHKITDIDKNIKYPSLKLISNFKDNKVHLFLVSNEKKNEKLVEKNFSLLKDTIYYIDRDGSLFSRIKCDFRREQNRHWKVRTGDWAIDGLEIDFNANHQDKYAYEVPWMMWNIRDVSVINDHELIASIEGRVILLDVKKKKIAFLLKAQDFQIKQKK